MTKKQSLVHHSVGHSVQETNFCLFLGMPSERLLVSLWITGRGPHVGQRRQRRRRRRHERSFGRETTSETDQRRAEALLKRLKPSTRKQFQIENVSCCATHDR